MGDLTVSAVPVTVVCHEVDTTVHSTVPPGWRWCVLLGAEPFDDQRRMLNAGWCPPKDPVSLLDGRAAAMIEGEAVGAAVAKALRLLGHQVAESPTVVLDHDPIPGEVG